MKAKKSSEKSSEIGLAWQCKSFDRLMKKLKMKPLPVGKPIIIKHSFYKSKEK